MAPWQLVWSGNAACGYYTAIMANRKLKTALATPPVRERLLSERLFHDRQADARAQALRQRDYCFDDASYLRHESWIEPAFDELGGVSGLRVLDLGCGHGMASVVLARRGATVTACDLSPGYLREARARADANGVVVRLVAANAERLPFADGTFERVWGNAILHHLDVPEAAAEIERVLRPGGVAVLCEPWAGNRWLNWARRALPYPGKQRTVDETPLTPLHLAQFRARFPSLRVRGYQFLSMLGRVVRRPALIAGLRWSDALLFRHLPGWQRYCRYVVIVARKAG
jgi:ubiquinone/menaquinone biosynthesis C-methylase UbiE